MRASIRNTNLIFYVRDPFSVVNLCWGELAIFYMDFKLDESHTPSKISIWTGNGFHNLKEDVNFQHLMAIHQIITAANVYVVV